MELIRRCSVHSGDKLVLFMVIWTGAFLIAPFYLPLISSPDGSSSIPEKPLPGEEGRTKTGEQDVNQDPPPASSVIKANVPKALTGHHRYYRVEYVFDGDSIKLKNEKELRLIGVDAPEKSKEFAGKARTYLRHILTKGTLIAVDFDRQYRDRYGRLLGYVYVIVDGDNEKDRKRLINEVMLLRGLARIYLHKHNIRWADRLILAQKQAIKNRRNLFRRITEICPTYYRAHQEYRYHAPDCKFIRDIPKKYLDVFDTRKEALLNGYNGASCCIRDED